MDGHHNSSIFYNFLTFMFYRHLQLVQGNNLAPIRYVDDENEVTGEIKLSSFLSSPSTSIILMIIIITIIIIVSSLSSSFSSTSSPLLSSSESLSSSSQ
jgi:hypothetical protein